MSTTRATLPAAALLAALALAAPARGDLGASIVERCTHGQSLSGFSQQAYRKALQEMPAEVNEYSDCANLIRKAQLAAAGGGTGAGAAAGAAGGGSLPAKISPPTPAEQRKLADAHRGGGAPVRVGGGVVDPGVVHTNVASALSTLPTPVLALLAFLLACALAIGAGAIRNRVRARRPR